MSILGFEPTNLRVWSTVGGSVSAGLLLMGGHGRGALELKNVYSGDHYMLPFEQIGVGVGVGVDASLAVSMLWFPTGRGRVWGRRSQLRDILDLGGFYYLITGGGAAVGGVETCLALFGLPAAVPVMLDMSLALALWEAKAASWFSSTSLGLQLGVSVMVYAGRILGVWSVRPGHSRDYLWPGEASHGVGRR